MTRRRIARLAAIAVLALGGALALPRGVVAHALLQSSDPAAGSTVAAAPTRVVMTFGEAPDPKLSSAQVLDSSGRNVASGPATAVAGHPDQLQVPLGTLPDGVYTVAWRTVSTVDGHTVAGSFAFGVGVSPGAAAATSGATTVTSSSASPAATVTRFLLYAGLILLFGAGLFGSTIHPGPARAILVLAVVAWLVSAAGAIGVVLVQARDTGADLTTFLGSGVGRGAVMRLAVAAVAGLAVGVLVARRDQPARWPYALVAVGGAAGMLVDVLNGHADASGSTLIQVGLQWLHILAVGVWFGGLTALLLGIRGAPDADKTRAAWRFRRLATVALATVVITGAVRAIQEVGSLDALVTTDYGLVLVAKSAVLLLLAGLGAVNHFVGVPAAIRSLRVLRRVGRIEVAAAAVVLLATGLLVNLVPPSSLAATAAPPPAPVTASGSDFGTTVRVKLVVTPGTPGINSFEAAVVDYDTGDPVAATSVQLRFASASATGVGSSTLRLEQRGVGDFAASGGNLSLDGIWKVTAVVAAPTTTVEVPLPIATQVAGLQIDSVPASGAPTIYTAHLPGGTTLQVYLDPGSAGPNELHSTFFDTAGNELPVLTATYLVEPASGPTAIVVPRQLEPGHFITDLQVAGDSLGADVAGPSPDGSMLHAHFDIPIHP
jgi:copper transport protein